MPSDVEQMHHLTLPKCDMFPKSDTFSGLSRRIRNRGYRLWAQFPMVGILAIALISVAMQEVLGRVWCNSLFFCFLASVVAVFCRWRVQALSIILAIALMISYFHSLSQQEMHERLANWEQSVQEFANEDGLGVGAWNPVACRGIIDTALRYRKTTLPGSKSDLGQVGWQTLTTLQVQEVRIGGRWSRKTLLMPLMVDGKLSGYFPGDAIELYGQWRLPSKPSNPGQFNQSQRYAELGYAAQARADSESQINRISGSSRIRIDRYLAMVSAQALWAIEKYVILGQSELTAALLLGQREQAEWKLQEELLATGTIHMLSISGMHIEMVALSLLLIGTFFQLPRKMLLLSICLIVIAYALLCGAGIPMPSSRTPKLILLCSSVQLR